MNSKMTTISQLSTTEPKKQNKLSKQLEQEQNHRIGDTWRVTSRNEEEGEWGKGYRE